LDERIGQYQGIDRTFGPEVVQPGRCRKSLSGRLPMNRNTGPFRFAGSILKQRTYICAFFNSPDEAQRVLLPFVKEGLELSEKTLHTN
jgi:hypothetical protein